MSKTAKAAPRDIEKEMVDLYLERGSMTNDALLGCGFTQEQIKEYGPKAAERIRLAVAA